MLLTLIKNNMGHIHIFKGAHNDCDFKYDKHNINLNGLESDLYMQLESDIQAVEFFINKEQTLCLNAGYAVVIEDPGYFGNGNQI